MSWKEATLVGFSGVRGVVALALTLIVDEDPAVPQAVKDIINFYVPFFVVLSLACKLPSYLIFAQLLNRDYFEIALQ